MRNAPTVTPVRRPVRCAIYTRQSVEKHNDLSSCQVQFDLCSAHIQSRRWSTVNSIIASRICWLAGELADLAGVEVVLPMGSPRHLALRQMQPADEHAYRALGTGNSVLLSMPADGRRARGLQGRDDLRP